ncbi:uncharacterized protein [Periplaneta americana]|uniref:uncharacterized protein n=1 Tax=Periplaneta americana TaxID=6978 RepID=UPI0037E8AF3E
MATMGVVPFSNTMTSHNKLQILQHNTSGVSESSPSGQPERREILILRKKPKPIVTLSEATNIPCETTIVNTSATTVLVNSNNSITVNAGRIRKKPSGVGGNISRSHHQPPPVAVARRNARERNRVKQVNNGFATLRQHIPLSVSSTYSSGDSTPGGRSSKKLSKVETLRMAVDYIRSLQQLLSMDDNESNTNITVSHSPNSSDASSPTSIVVHSPSSPANSSTNPSTAELHSYQHYEDDSVQTDMAGSPILIEDEDDTSLIDPTSPAPSTLTSSSYTPEYHRIRNTNTFIHLVNAQQDIVNRAESTTQYEVDESFPPISVTSTSFPNESYIPSSAQIHRLHAPHLISSIDTYQHATSGDLVIVGDTSVINRHHPTSSLSPEGYSEQSLSPETSGVDDMTLLRNTTSASFLPSFSASLKSTSSPTSTLQLVTSPPLQLVASSETATTVVRSQSYPANVELLSHVKMEQRLGEEDGVADDVIEGNGQDVVDMMAWWEQEQRLRLVTSVASTATSTS